MKQKAFHLSESGSRGGEIKPLTSFRFLAAVAVFLTHATPPASPLSRFVSEGYVGVAFFFVLSGFILTYNYHDKVRNWGAAVTFYLARFARVWPVHLLGFMISVPLVYGALLRNPASEVLRGFLNLSLLQSFSPLEADYFSFDSPAWSLSNEAFFYVLFPGILLVLTAMNLTTKRRALAVGVGFWLLASIVVWLYRDIEIAHWLFYIFPLSRLVDFLLGVSLGFFFLGTRGARISVRAMTVMEVTALVGFLVELYYAPAVPQALRYAVYYLPFLGMTVLVFAYQQGRVARLLSSPVPVLLGEISFSFYILHQLVIRYLQTYNVITDNPLALALAAFVVTLVASYLCYRLYELPARKYLRRHFGIYPVASAAPDGARHGGDTLRRAAVGIASVAVPTLWILGGAGIVASSSSVDLMVVNASLNFLGAGGMTDLLPLRLGDRTVLTGYSLEPAQGLKGGGRVDLRMLVTCAAGQRQPTELRVDLVDAEDHLWSSGVPDGGDADCPSAAGEAKHIGQYRFDLPPTMPTGEFQFSLSLFDQGLGQYLAVKDASGNTVGNRVLFANVPIAKNRDSWAASQLSIEQPYFADMAEMRLLGLAELPRTIRPGSVLAVGLYWRARTKPRGDYAVAVQLRDDADTVLLERSERPAGGTFPTTGWNVGEVLLDWHDLIVPSGIAAGTYEIYVLLRDTDSGEVRGRARIADVQIAP